MNRVTGMDQPGIYEGFGEAEYHALPWVSKSDLDLFAVSPFRYWAFKIAPNRPAREGSDAFFFGSAFHAALLEPERFGEEYVVAPPGDRRTKEYKAFAKEHEGAHILTEKQATDIERMKEQISKIDFLKKVFGKTMNEVSIHWIDEETGLGCRARLDAICMELATIFDPKTTASLTSFERKAFEFRYHCQAAWYSDGLKKALEQSGREYPAEGFDFALIVSEKEYPNASGLYCFSPDALELGRQEMRRNLRGLKTALEKNEWPSMSAPLVELDIPYWLKNKVNAEEMNGNDNDDRNSGSNEADSEP